MTEFVFYAQFGEDFLLWRMLRDVDVGTYFDVGACEPEFHSVTKAFPLTATTLRDALAGVR